MGYTYYEYVFRPRFYLFLFFFHFTLLLVIIRLWLIRETNVIFMRRAAFSGRAFKGGTAFYLLLLLAFTLQPMLLHPFVADDATNDQSELLHFTFFYFVSLCFGA